MYGASRFALYESFKTKYRALKSAEPPTSILIPAAAISGTVGGVIGNPADIANVRMQNDKGLDHASRRNYRHVGDAFIRIGKEEGVKGFSRGLGPNACRAAVMTASQLASYDVFKTALIQRLGAKDNLLTHFAASLLAGVVATTLCSPADVIKTKMMSLSDSKPIIEVLREMNRTEGLRWVFRGWFPSFMRVGPHTIATFLFFEQHKAIYNKLMAVSGSDALL
jgi:solute carrier family 25 (mitochondrial dicarboxylate transporter), member 10